MKQLNRFLIFALVLSAPLQSWAWGRRGHQIVGENAALLASQAPESSFMSGHSFDFGYYANVPDFIWKRPSTFGMEGPQHYINMEVFEREFAKHPEVTEPYALSRKEFDTKFPAISEKSGRAFWRIRELYAKLEKITQELRDLKEQSGEARQKLQEKWLVIAGIMAHYVGDLSMPLHISENHDGQLTDQKGIHSYFEDIVVDAMFPEIGCEVHQEALKKWPAFSAKNKDKSVLALLLQLGEKSKAEVPRLLALDKKIGRKDLKAAVLAYRPMIRQQMTESVLTLAELYRRQLGWKFDNNKFFFFAGEPEYIPPGD